MRQVGLGTACALLIAGVAEAKPDKGKGKGHDKGGKAGHSEKGKKKGKDNPGNPGKHDDKGHHKAEKELRKDIEKNRKEARKAVEKRDKETAKWSGKRFRDDDRAGVVRYFDGYRDKEHGLPPGLAKQYRAGRPLPPGWQKKVHNGYVIEDDWNPYFHPVSYETFPFVEREPDTRLYWYGDRIVRVYEPRRQVVDVIIVPTIRFD